MIEFEGERERESARLGLDRARETNAGLGLRRLERERLVESCVKAAGKLLECKSYIKTGKRKEGGIKERMEEKSLRATVLSTVATAAVRCEALEALEKAIGNDLEVEHICTESSTECGVPFLDILAKALLMEEVGQQWRLSVAVLDACARLAKSLDPGFARAWICARVLSKCAQPNCIAEVERAAVTTASALWFDEDELQENLCVEAVLALDQISVLRCLGAQGIDDRIKFAFARCSSDVIERLTKEPVSKDASSSSSRDVVALNALGAALTSARNGRKSYNSSSEEAPEDLLLLLVKNITLSNVGYFTLEPVLCGYLDAMPASEIPSSLIASICEELIPVASLEGPRYFDAAALENWPYLEQAQDSPSVSIACSSAQARASASLAALITLIERAALAGAKFQNGGRLLRSMILACAGWMGVGPKSSPDCPEESSATLDAPWSCEACAILSVRLLNFLNQHARQLFVRECSDTAKNQLDQNGALSACGFAPIITNIMKFEAFELGMDTPECFWSELRARLAGGQWKYNQWQACAGLCAVIFAVDRCNARELVAGDVCMGELIPSILPLIDDGAPHVRAAGSALLNHLCRLMTPTEVRWHSTLLLDRTFALIGVSREADALGPGLLALLQLLDKSEAAGPPWSLHISALDELLSLASVLPATSNTIAEEQDSAVLNKAKKRNASLCLAFVIEAATELTRRLELFAVQFLPGLIEAASKGAGMGGELHMRLRTASANLIITCMSKCKPRIPAHQSALIAVIARHRIMLDKTSKSELLLAETAMSLLKASAEPVALEQQVERLRCVVPSF